MNEEMNSIYTIGHSNHEPEKFIWLLQQNQIDTLVDVRSNPNSSWASFSNRDNLQKLLRTISMNYIYMGETLGGKPPDVPGVSSKDKKVDYNMLRQCDDFVHSIQKLIELAHHSKTCIMCAEENPVHCHRSLLIGAALSDSKINILHIRGNGKTQTDDELSKERAGVPANQQRLSL